MKFNKILKGFIKFFKRAPTPEERIIEKKIKKSGIFKIIFKLIKLFFLLICIFIGAFIYSIAQHDLDYFKDFLINTAENSLNAHVQINGKMSWKLSLKPSINLNNVVVETTLDDGLHIYVKADKIDVTIKALSLLKQTPVISKAKFINSVINIQQTSSMKKQRFDPKDSNNKFLFNPKLNLRFLEFENTEIKYKTIDNNLSFHPDNIKLTMGIKRNVLASAGVISYKNNLYSFSLKSFPSVNGNYPVTAEIYNSDIKLKSSLKLNTKTFMPDIYDLSMNVQNINKHLSYLGIDKIFPIAPLKITAVGSANKHNIIVDDLKINTSKSDLNLRARINLRNKIPDINLDMNSNTLNLSEVFPTLYGNYIPEPDPTDRPLNAFKDTPLYTNEIFNSANIELKAKINNLIMYRKMKSTKNSVLLSLRDGVLNLATSCDFYKGKVETVVWGRYISKESGLTCIASSRARNIYPGLLLNSMNYSKTLVGLPTDYEFYFTANGADLENLMSNLNGSIHVYSTDSGIAYDATKYVLGQDFLSNLKSTLTDIVSNNDESNNQKIKCAVVNLKIRDGVLKTQKGIALETNMVNMLGVGEINFKEETLQASLVSSPNRGLKLSLSGNVLDVLEMKGSISEPSIQINQTGLLSKTITAGIAGIALAPLTGGLSFLATAGIGLITESALSSWLSDAHPCETAQNEGAPINEKDPNYMKENLDQVAKSIWLKVNNEISNNLKKYFKI